MSVAAFISVWIKETEIWCKRPELLSIWLRPAKAIPGSWGCGGVCGGAVDSSVISSRLVMAMSCHVINSGIT